MAEDPFLKKEYPCCARHFDFVRKTRPTVPMYADGLVLLRFGALSPSVGGTIPPKNRQNDVFHTLGATSIIDIYPLKSKPFLKKEYPCCARHFDFVRKTGPTVPMYADGPVLLRFGALSLSAGGVIIPLVPAGISHCEAIYRVLRTYRSSRKGAISLRDGLLRSSRILHDKIQRDGQQHIVFLLRIVPCHKQKQQQNKEVCRIEAGRKKTLQKIGDAGALLAERKRYGRIAGGRRGRVRGSRRCGILDLIRIPVAPESAVALGNIAGIHSRHLSGEGNRNFPASPAIFAARIAFSSRRTRPPLK